MAWAKQQAGKSASGSGTTISTSFGSTPTPGNVIVVGVEFFDGTSVAPTITVVDGNSNSYTVSGVDSGTTNESTAGWISIAYSINIPANAHGTITVTFSKSATASVIAIDEFNPGIAGSGVSIDMSPTFANGTSAITGPTVTVAAASNDLLFAITSDASSVTGYTGGWTLNDGGLQLGNGSGYVLNAKTSTAVSATGVASNAWNCVAMSFKIPIPPVRLINRGRPAPFKPGMAR